MCFGGGGDNKRTPSLPTYSPPPIPQAPPAPPPVQKIAAPQPVSETGEPKVRKKSSTRQRMGIRRGASQLRIPLNTGTDKSGGLNV